MFFRACCWGLVWITTTVSAHPISLTSTDIQIREGALAVRIEVMLEDLVLFHSLKPVRESLYTQDDLRAAALLHQDVLISGLTLLDGQGKRMEGTASPLDLSALTEAVPQEHLMQRRLRFDFTYQRVLPSKFLTVVHRLGENDVGVPAIMDLSIQRDGAWIHRPSQLMLPA